MRTNQNADRRQRRRARHQQSEATEAENSAVSTKYEAQVQTHVYVTKRDARVHELRVTTPIREALDQSLAAPKREVRVSLQERETRVQPKAASQCDLHVSNQRREVRVQKQIVP